jgi:hypothetical protein
MRTVTLLSMTVVVWVVVLSGASQTEPPRSGAASTAAPRMAEEAFKNIQVLKGIPVDQFMATMGFFSASLGLNCTDCHSDESGGNWEKYADDTPLKRAARRMVTMTQQLNETNFGGRQMVTCNTCHRGIRGPNVMPSIDQLYASPPPDEPGDPITQAVNQPSADAILDMYIAATGGEERVAALTSLTATGTYHAYDDAAESPLEVFVTADGRYATIAHPPSGTTATAFDGRDGVFVAPATDRPFRVIPITGTELDGVKLQAQLFFPSRIKQTLRNWRVGFPTDIDGRRVNVVQGALGTTGVATLCFDAQTGLLKRMIRYGPSPVGRVVTRIDYGDYREVNGVKIPSKWILSWLDGRTVFTLTNLRANVTIDASKFAAPASN